MTRRTRDDLEHEEHEEHDTKREDDLEPDPKRRRGNDYFPSFLELDDKESQMEYQFENAVTSEYFQTFNNYIEELCSWVERQKEKLKDKIADIEECKYFASEELEKEKKMLLCYVEDGEDDEKILSKSKEIAEIKKFIKIMDTWIKRNIEHIE
jgi:hypothetical protein